MNVPDLINGMFEMFGGIFICKSIVKLHEDKLVRGVHWLPILFFCTWGYWNLYYYPQLGQMLSFIGGLSVVTANTIWLGQIFYYLYKEGK